jgi:hypothetical protein
VTSALVEPTASHVHRAAAGENALDAVFELTQMQSDPNHWFAERQTVSAEQLQDFNESLWYLDVHTTGLLDGAVRGQIVTTSAPPAARPTATPARSRSALDLHVLRAARRSRRVPRVAVSTNIRPLS